MLTRAVYLLLVVSAMTFLGGCSNDNPAKKIPDLRESFSPTDKKPFGTYIAYKQIGEMYYRNTIQDGKKSFEDIWKYQDDTGSIAFCFAQSLFTTEEDEDAMLKYVENGNDIFCAAQEFEASLMLKLGCQVSWDMRSLNRFSIKPFQDTRLSMKVGGVQDSASYRYFYLPFGGSFSSINSTDTRVLGVNENGNPDFIVVFRGKGRIFLHCDPRAFSNYFLLQRNNYEYLQKAFGYLRSYPDHVYWNNYYSKLHSVSEARSSRNKGDDDDFSSVGELMKHPSLATAFWLSLILMVLYILFTMKRRQRVIEIIKPNENTTVTFTETIGRLYLQKKDNKNIADKMMTYFNEYIRNNYFLNTNNVNKEFMSTLSRKSGVPLGMVQALYHSFGHVQGSEDINDYQLLYLNKQIQDFFKKRG